MNAINHENFGGVLWWVGRFFEEFGDFFGFY
jgi:hypothetical protein